nr:carbon-nitrogen family hydrolase [Ardenticatena sp.]
MSVVRVSIAQFSVQQANPTANLETVAAYAAEAAARGSEVLVLPELWGHGYDLANADTYAAELNAGLFAETARLARQHGLFIYGSLLGRRQGHPANMAALFAPDGAVVAAYSKIHLFRLMDEDRWLTPGEEGVLVDAPWGATGLAICYDLRFPELFRRYALEGAQVFFICAQWPKARLTHWRTLLRARAIENQAVVVACNRCGETDGTLFGGHSVILDAWGQPVVEAGEAPVLLTADVDIASVASVRRKIPIFQDRRPVVYDAPLHRTTINPKKGERAI